MMEKHYFPAANTPIGFYPCFSNILPQERAKQIIYIKGGSGTGKSTFMRGVGKTMLERGNHVELYHCSSDPDSLDGVHIVEKGVAIFDATAPHAGGTGKN